MTLWILLAGGVGLVLAALAVRDWLERGWTLYKARTKTVLESLLQGPVEEPTDILEVLQGRGWVARSARGFALTDKGRILAENIVRWGWHEDRHG